jgi:Tetratricopeptide repeat
MSPSLGRAQIPKCSLLVGECPQGGLIRDLLQTRHSLEREKGWRSLRNTVLNVAKDDWYRGPAWDPGTREHFEEGLSRARTQRPQYLRIKGCELTQADDPLVWAPGRGLLKRVLNEHPDDELCVIEAHHDLGWSFAREGQYAEAAKHYEASLALQRQRGGSIDPGTRLALAELLVDAGWEQRY